MQMGETVDKSSSFVQTSF